MKLLLALTLLPGIALAAGSGGSGEDGQSVFEVSETRTLNYGTTASRTTVLPADAKVVRVTATTTAHKKEGKSTVTATTSDTLLPAYTPEYFKIPRNSSNTTYISAIGDTASGTLFIDLMKP